MDEKLIARINELANKKKTEGLSEAEQQEQKELREQYLKEFRANTEKQLINLKIVDEDGNDVTPDKLKKAKEERDKS